MKTLKQLENDIEIAIANIKYYSRIKHKAMLEIWTEIKEKLILDLVCNY
jgi:hypothetical protein